MNNHSNLPLSSTLFESLLAQLFLVPNFDYLVFRRAFLGEQFPKMPRNSLLWKKNFGKNYSR